MKILAIVTNNMTKHDNINTWMTLLVTATWNIRLDSTQ